MSQQGPIIIVSTAQRPSFAGALDDAKIFPVIDTGWADASRAIDELQPAAVLVTTSDAVKADVETLAKRIASRQPYLPLLAIDPDIGLPENAIPFSQADGNFDRLIARLRAALRTRSLHATVMRRLDDPGARKTLADFDPARDATVLLIGRGAAYPALSVSLGERMGVVGALSVEAAAKHLNARDIDGIVLTVLTEDARFRNLPVIVTLEGVTPAYDLANLEVISGVPARVLPPTRCR
jgi:hypothetical protein